MSTINAGQLIVLSSNGKQNQSADAELAQLGAKVRADLKALGQTAGSVLVYALDLGDALTRAKVLVHRGEWLPWLAENGGLSARSAQDYMRLAKHREAVEARMRSSAADLSLRGALRWIGNRSVSRKQRKAPAKLKVADWKVASLDERKVFVAGIPVVEWLAAITPAQRAELDDRFEGLRNAKAPVKIERVPIYGDRKKVTAPTRH